jgi:hypothetical protein
MSDGDLDDLYQEVWAGFTRPPTSPNGTTLTSEDVPMTATLDSPMLPDEYSTCILALLFEMVSIADCQTVTHGRLPARTMSAVSNSSVTESNGTACIYSASVLFL